MHRIIVGRVRGGRHPTAILIIVHVNDIRVSLAAVANGRIAGAALQPERCQSDHQHRAEGCSQHDCQHGHHQHIVGQPNVLGGIQFPCQVQSDGTECCLCARWMILG